MFRRLENLTLLGVGPRPWLNDSETQQLLPSGATCTAPSRSAPTYMEWGALHCTALHCTALQSTALLFVRIQENALSYDNLYLSLLPR